MEQLAFSVVTDQHGGIIVNCPAHPMIDNSDIDAQFSKIFGYEAPNVALLKVSTSTFALKNPLTDLNFADKQQTIMSIY